MKKILFLGILPVFAISLLSFSNPVETKITETFTDCKSYCNGYADAKEEEEPMTMEEWNAVREACLERMCQEE